MGSQKFLENETDDLAIKKPNKRLQNECDTDLP